MQGKATVRRRHAGGFGGLSAKVAALPKSAKQPTVQKRRPGISVAARGPTGRSDDPRMGAGDQAADPRHLGRRVPDRRRSSRRAPAALQESRENLLMGSARLPNLQE